MTQPKARPPFFVLFGNSVEHIPESYKRYLVNGLRETFGLIGVPIRLSHALGRRQPLRAEEAATLTAGRPADWTDAVRLEMRSRLRFAGFLRKTASDFSRTAV